MGLGDTNWLLEAYREEKAELRRKLAAFEITPTEKEWQAMLQEIEKRYSKEW